MILKTNLANKQNYGSKRSTSSIKYIVIHYTANDGDSDESNGKYFHNHIVQASAHYFVDSDSVTQSVPDNYIAYHCGAKYYKHAYCRNTNSIGIELCDDIKNGIIYPSTATINNALELVKMLMKKYNIPKENVIRHFDVTGKLCPAYWCGTAEKNNLWKSEFWNKINGTSVSTSSYLVKVTADVLNVRTGPSTQYNKVRTIKKGEVYTIIETKNGWGRLKSKIGWISLAYTQKI